MVLTLKDFASMRLPVAVFVASIILSAVMIKFSSVQNKAAETQRGSQAAALKEASDR